MSCFQEISSIAELLQKEGVEGWKPSEKLLCSNLVLYGAFVLYSLSPKYPGDESTEQ